MDEWAWADPAELRIRLDVALQHAAELEADNDRLRSMLRRVGIDVEARSGAPTSVPNRAPAVVVAAVPPSVTASLAADALREVTANSPIEAKIALFGSLFAGREDVYARRWVGKDGRTGWSPAQADPFNKALTDAQRTFSR